MPTATAAGIANTVAEVAVDATNRMNRTDVDVLDAELKTMVDTAAERLKVAEQAHEDYRKGAQLEALEREVETLLEQRTDLMSLSVQLEAERARFEQAKREAARQEHVRSLLQSVVDDPAMHAMCHQRAPPAASAYHRDAPRGAQRGIGAARRGGGHRERRCGGARTASRDARPGGGLGRQGHARLNELYAGEARLERLSVELQLARQAYEGVSAKYQSARLSALARTPQLRVVDPAIVPDLPRGQVPVRNVLLGFIAGTLLACGVVILHDALRAS